VSVISQFTGRFSAVTVGASNFALGDLSFNRRPSTAPHQIADISDLHAANMVEVEDNRGGFSAFDAGMLK
jgi:hypothetical protein